jgi:hypothetical protein
MKWERMHREDRNVGGPRAQKLWRLMEVGIASRIVGETDNARAQMESSEVV